MADIDFPRTQTVCLSEGFNIFSFTYYPFIVNMG